MTEHIVSRQDCLSVASKEEVAKLNHISDIHLLKALAGKWCTLNNYLLGGYLGNWKWDALRRTNQ